VEEGKRYKFGDVKVDSQLRDFDGDKLAERLSIKKGQWYNAKAVEDTVDSLTETAGSFGYAFADVRPDFQRDKDDLTMSVTFRMAEAPRVYVERVDVNGNTLTQDKVVRREFRLGEGDAFNSLQIKRSTNRIKSLGYFQESSRSSRSPAARPTASCWKPTSRKSRPASSSFPPASPALKASSSRPRSSRTTSVAVARPLASASTIRAIRARCR
jgi:outer membrane protein insertion porin family